MIGVLVKRRFGDIGRMLFEGKGRDRIFLHTKEAKSLKQTLGYIVLFKRSNEPAEKTRL